MRCAMPTRSSASITRFLRSGAGILCRYVSGSSTFSKTVRSPIRLKLWKMNPMWRLRRSARSRWGRAATGSPSGKVAALGGRVEQAEDRQERGLAGARGPLDRDELAPADGQLHSRQGVGLDVL